MPYIHRTNGEITCLTRWPNGSEEFLADHHSDVEAFGNTSLPPPSFETAAQAIENAADWSVVRAVLAQTLRDMG